MAEFKANCRVKAHGRVKALGCLTQPDTWEGYSRRGAVPAKRHEAPQRIPEVGAPLLDAARNQPHRRLQICKRGPCQVSPPCSLRHARACPPCHYNSNMHCKAAVAGKLTGLLGLVEGEML